MFKNVSVWILFVVFSVFTLISCTSKNINSDTEGERKELSQVAGAPEDGDVDDDWDDEGDENLEGR